MSHRTIRIAGKILGQVVLLLGAIAFSLPTLYMISASLMSGQELFSTELQLLPSVPQWNNYSEVFLNFNFGRYLMNSIIVTGSVVLLNLILTPMVGYSLAKFDYP
ncbi:MAG: carbohydrate ABC transporter permease, partial [Caldilineaceae bacterium]|nr:carbohydrate ABC transporter permease [Caldilineaceae bacterium]